MNAVMSREYAALYDAASLERTARRALTVSEMVPLFGARLAARYAIMHLRACHLASEEDLRELPDDKLHRYLELLERAAAAMRDLIEMSESPSVRRISTGVIAEAIDLTRSKLDEIDETAHIIHDIVDERTVDLDDGASAIPWADMKTRIGWA